MSAWSFARATLLNGASPACAWRHPVQAGRVVGGALRDAAAGAVERLLPGGPRSCPICGWRGRAFRTFLSADEVIPACICPGCGSFDRQRLLALAVRRELDRRRAKPGVMLAVAQSPAMQRLLLQEGAGRCFRTDVTAAGPFTVEFVSDLRAAAVAGGAVDWLFCSHVLEHVAELDACLGEIVRMLRPGGVAWIQVPQEPGLDRSRRIEIDPHRAHAHAWQFGVDFPQLLARPGCSVTEIAAADLAGAPERRSWGIGDEERCWLLRRSP